MPVCVTPQVEVITKKLPCGSAVEVQRHMAAGSCIGVEVWQRPGLLGDELEQQLTSLVTALSCTASLHCIFGFRAQTSLHCIAFWFQSLVKIALGWLACL